MSNEVQIYSVPDLKEMGRVMATTGMFGFKKPDEAFALMLIAQAEGRHPATIAQDYDVIQGRPALKSVAALARFQIAGGRVQWIESNHERAVAEFSHPSGGTLCITWDMERARIAQLAGKDNWKKFPDQMLRARCAAEGVRAVFPACLNGMYVSEEVQDFEPRQDTAKPPAKPSNRVEVSQLPPVELAAPVERDTLLADLKALGATKAQILETMGVKSLRSWDEMTAEQFASLDQMRHTIQSQQTETTEPTEQREF